MASKWRVLVVEDDRIIAGQIESDASSGRLLPPVGAIECEICATFEEAVPHLEASRFDFLILDLRKDANLAAPDDPTPGLTVFEEIKKRRFVPIIFYTALAHHVRNLETTFVRVVEKSEGLRKLRTEVLGIYNTELPNLVRHLEEEQRNYMWDFVDKQWKQLSSPYEKADLAYLLARRLANMLQRVSIRRFLRGEDEVVSDAADYKKVHPVEMYIKPPDDSVVLAGQIIKGPIKGDEAYWIVLTPSCDFEQGKVNRALLARCSELTEEPEYKEFSTQRNSATEGKLKSLLRDNRKGKQPERFKYLPGTFFIPDLLIDFQHLVQVPRGELDSMEKVAALDSPFAESVVARFSRYYGRIGTPNLDVGLVLSRMLSLLPKNKR